MPLIDISLFIMFASLVAGLWVVSMGLLVWADAVIWRGICNTYSGRCYRGDYD